MEALGTFTSEGGSVIEAPGIEATWVVLALVEAAAVGVGVTPGTWRTFAHKASVLINAASPGPTWVTQALIEVSTLSNIGEVRKYDIISRQ